MGNRSAASSRGPSYRNPGPAGSAGTPYGLALSAPVAANVVVAAAATLNIFTSLVLFPKRPTTRCRVTCSFNATNDNAAGQMSVNLLVNGVVVSGSLRTFLASIINLPENFFVSWVVDVAGPATSAGIPFNCQAVGVTGTTTITAANTQAGPQMTVDMDPNTVQ